MKYHAIGYLVILMLLSGCSTLAASPVLPEVTIKIGLRPAVVVECDEVVTEVMP